MPAAVFVPSDQNVGGQRREQQRERKIGHLYDVPAADQASDRAADELKTGDREKHHDRERSERLELAVAVRVLVVRRARRHADHKQAEDVVDGVDGGVHRVADDGERAREDTDTGFSDYNEDVRDQQSGEHAPHGARPV